MSTNSKQQQLITKLKELFMMDQADLDFGIYRIMNARHDEIESFLQNDLLPTIRQTLQANGKNEAAKQELEELTKTLTSAGMNPDESPKVQELKALLGDGANASLEKDEEETFSHLHTFFSRYYDGGDFMSLRRYRQETYSPLPMNGEEVKLHWANADQYYIKSAENFTHYAFRLDRDQGIGVPAKHVRFELTQASTEQNNKKESTGKERRFVLDENQPLSLRSDEEGDTLILHFTYQPETQKRKQKDLNSAVIELIRGLTANNTATKDISDWQAWQTALLTPMPTEKNKKRTALEKYLTDYTAKNSFDYFIHKDLGGFLRRELDFFIKNELLLLDDIIPTLDADNGTSNTENTGDTSLASQLLSNERSLRKVAAFKSIAQKLIAFLAQLEDFQKKLWLKKKFILESHYCFTLDRVPGAFYDEIAANAEQVQEWRNLGVLDDEVTEVNADFLQQQPTLMVDTGHFDAHFKQRLLAEIEGLDEQTDGLLIHSENFQALNLMQERYREQVKCVYIDPPYNTNVSSIPYKNNYRHSSWATMMRDKVSLLSHVLSEDGALFASIDKIERSILEYAMDSVFGNENKVEELIWIQNTNDGRSPTYSTNHEYVEVYAKKKSAVEADFTMFREPKPGYEQVMEIVRELNPLHPSISEIQDTIRNLYKNHKKNYKEKVLQEGLDWEVEKRNDPWKGLYNYNRAEYRDKAGNYLDESLAKEKKGVIWIWREDNWTIMSSDSKQSVTTKDPNHKNYRYYRPIHPVTGKPCKPSSRGWKGTQFIDPEYPQRNSLESLMNDHRIAFGEDENKVPQQKRFLHEVDTNVSKSVFTDYSDGEKETTAMFGRSGVFLAPKHSNFVKRFITQSANQDSYIFDCFGGSGSTAHAVINANREDDGKRKYVLVEVADYFNSLIKPRVKKALFSSNWESGKASIKNAKAIDSISHCFKYLVLESYEDVLDNLQLTRTQTQGDLLADNNNKRLKQDYLLHYMLDVESRGSLLNASMFIDPFNAQMRVVRNNETREQAIDLVETFNYLLGLTVQATRKQFDLIEVVGTNPQGQNVHIVWRNQNTTDNDALDEWFRKQSYNTRDTEFDLIYVNGDNNLPNLRTGEESWKVQLIEDVFQILMFDTRDV